MPDQASAQVLEGVFAINKPPGISSAQVIRDVQSHFTPSKLLAPCIAREQARKEQESYNQKKKRRSWKSKQPMQLKIGHGGTLDPMATGVLILGLGNGTKALGGFLKCTKSYDTVVLFGAATDSYDTQGKVVARKPYQHINRDKVEEALGRFRGSIMQRPPIFSALRVSGKRLYEYAREGKEVPVEIEERPVTVEELEVEEWYDGGTHEWNWPDKEAGQVEKEVVEKVLHFGGDEGTDCGDDRSGERKKRKREDSAEEMLNGAVTNSAEARKSKTEDEAVASGALPEGTAIAANDLATTQPTSDQLVPSLEKCSAPAVRLRMTVTSGFYVRSLAHDLGAALGSAGIMTSLVRTRQGDFQLGTNVLWYEDLAKGEEHWGPKVNRMLEDWQTKQSIAKGGEQDEEHDVENEREGWGAVNNRKGSDSGAGKRRSHGPKPAARAKVRTNSSSDDDR